MPQARRSVKPLGLGLGLLVCLGGVGFSPQGPAGDAGGGPAFMGVAATKLYHRPNCPALKRAAAKDRIKLDDAAKAQEQMLTPCPVCRPDQPLDPPPAGKLKGKVKAKPAPGKKGAGAATKEDGTLKFSRDIAPILVGNCAGCHNAQQRRGKFDMTSFDKLMKGSDRTPVIDRENPDQSELLLRIKGEADGRPKMPPGNLNLAPEAIAKIDAWIKAGARYDLADTAATLESIAPSPEQRRQADLAKLSAEDRDKKLAEVAEERWKKVTSKAKPEMVAGRSFVVFSNLPAERAKATLKVMEDQRTRLGTLLGPVKALAPTAVEKISLYVFNDAAAYAEFVRGVESREVEAGAEAHGKLDVEAPYLAAIDPLGGRDDPALARKPGARTKKDEDDGPADRTLAGLLSEQFGIAAAATAGKAPRWLSAGLGAYLAAQVEPRNPYYRRLREDAAQQYQLGWKTKANEALGGEGSPEAVRAIGFSFFEWISTAYRPVLAPFTREMLAGQEKLDDTIKAAWGPEATREQFLTLWGNWIAARSGPGGRRR